VLAFTITTHLRAKSSRVGQLSPRAFGQKPSTTTAKIAANRSGLTGRNRRRMARPFILVDELWTRQSGLSFPRRRKLAAKCFGATALGGKCADYLLLPDRTVQSDSLTSSC